MLKEGDKENDKSETQRAKLKVKIQCQTVSDKRFIFPLLLAMIFTFVWLSLKI